MPRLFAQTVGYLLEGDKGLIEFLIVPSSEVKLGIENITVPN